MIGLQFPWVSCQGGPHLLLPSTILSEWRPHERSSAGHSDYQMVSNLALQRDIAVFELADAQGLVIGGCDVPMSTWIANENGVGGDIVVALEWSSEPVDQSILDALRALPKSAFRPENLSITIAGNAAVLLAACDSPPKWFFPHSEFPFFAGKYEIASTECDIDDYCVFRVHRLAPSAAR